MSLFILSFFYFRIVGESQSPFLTKEIMILNLIPNRAALIHKDHFEASNVRFWWNGLWIDAEKSLRFQRYTSVCRIFTGIRILNRWVCLNMHWANIHTHNHRHLPSVWLWERSEVWMWWLFYSWVLSCSVCLRSGGRETENKCECFKMEVKLFTIKTYISTVLHWHFNCVQPVS